jgi:hypothetical protein
MRSAARPSFEGDSAAKVIGKEPIGRMMKRSFCDGVIAGKGIVKAIDEARRSFCDHSANDRGRADRQNDEAIVVKAIVIKAIVGDGIVKARGDHQSNRRCEAIILGGDRQRGPIGNILRRVFSQIIGERAGAQEGGGSVRWIHRGSCDRRVLEIDTRGRKQKGTLQSKSMVV